MVSDGLVARGSPAREKCEVVELSDQPAEDLVVARLSDEGVQPAVCRIEFGRIAGLASQFADACLEQASLGGGSVAGGELGRERLQCKPDLEDRGDVDRGDKGPRSAAGFDDVLSGQPANRFAHGGAGGRRGCARGLAQKEAGHRGPVAA